MIATSSTGIASLKDSDLVSAVSRLVTSMETTSGRRDPLVRNAIVEEMLALAANAQAKLTDQSRRINYLEHLAHSDELTGLHNRRAFLGELRLALANARRYGENGALVFVDLDGFKDINDVHGHAAGDAVLKQVATMLRDLVRETDVVSRLGGDEFAILLTRTNSENAFRRARIIERALNRAVADFDDKTLPIAASFGIEVFTGRDDEAALLDRADKAMYERKRERKGANENDRPARRADGGNRRLA
jgi:diguanylate cyclase (GGDEF)-like protein